MVEGVEDINILNRNERFCKVFETVVLRIEKINKDKSNTFPSHMRGGGS